MDRSGDRPVAGGQVEAVLDDGVASVAHKVARLQIERQVSRATRVASELLDLLRLGNCQQCRERERLDLREVVERAIQTVESTAFSHQHHLVVWLPDAPIWLHADRGGLGWVLVSLLLNVVQNTGDGGDLIVFGQQERDHALLRVQGCGRGIAPELLPRVFDACTLTRRSAHSSEPTLGLRLALARSFVELHRGTLEAASDGPGLGSEFMVRLPIG